MKKTLLAFAALALGVTSVSAETLYTLQFGKDYNEKGVSAYTNTSFKVAVDATTKAAEEYTWNVVNFNNNNNGWAYVKCGNKTAATTSSIINLTAWPELINEIVINAQNGGTNSATSAFVYVLQSATDDLSDALAKYDITTSWNQLSKSATDITVTIAQPVANAFYELVIDCPKYSANGAFQINKITYNGTADTSLLNPELKFPEASYTVEEGETFDAPVATQVGDGTITYSSSDDSVATVDAETGAVTLVGNGTTIITAKVDATDTYMGASATYTLTYNCSVVVGPEAPYSSALGEDFTFEQENSYPWTHDASYGLKGTAYVNGTSQTAEGYAVSPVFNFADRKNITLKFDQALNQFKLNNNNIDPSEATDYVFVVVREKDSDEWEVLDDAVTAPTAFNWNFFANEPISLDAYKDKKVQVGFKYTSKDGVAGTWEIKNIGITADLETGVSEIEADAEGEAVYYNLQGVRVANPDKGLFIVVKGGKSSKVIF